MTSSWPCHLNFGQASAAGRAAGAGELANDSIMVMNWWMVVNAGYMLVIYAYIIIAKYSWTMLDLVIIR